MLVEINVYHRIDDEEANADAEDRARHYRAAGHTASVVIN